MTPSRSGDVRLLGALLWAETERMPVPAAEELLSSDADCSSPFVALPI